MIDRSVDLVLGNGEVDADTQGEVGGSQPLQGEGRRAVPQ